MVVVEEVEEDEVAKKEGKKMIMRRRVDGD